MSEIEKPLIYQFDEYLIDTVEETLHRNGEKVIINRRTFQVLRLLVERAGQIVTKQEFFDTVWADTFVGDNSLTVTMTTLRKVLGEDARQAKFIENLPRKGYRFIGEMKIGGDESAVAQVEEKGIIAPTADVSKKTVSNSKNQKALIGIFAACLVFLLAVIGFKYFGSSQSQFISINNLQIKSVAVLPLTTENASPEQQIFAEKLTEDLTRNLGRVTDARVAAYHTLALMDSPDTDLSKIADDLNVDGFVVGKIIGKEEAADLEIKLSDAASGAVFWEKRYALDRRNLAESQYRVANDIARELGKNREIQNPAAAVNYEAYQSYLLARHHLDKRTTKDYEAAIKNFTGAIAKDSAFADAHAGLATTHVLHGQNIYAARGLSAFGESFPAAKRSAVRALEINPNSDEALAVLAFVNYRFEYNWKNAETNFKRAIEINSNNVLAHRWYGEFLHHVGRFEEGFVVQKKALALEPNSTLILGETARGNYLARHFDEAAKNIEAALSIDKNNAAALYKASEIYEQKKDYTQAAALWRDAMIVEEANPKSIAHLEESFQKAGYHGFVRAKTDWLENLTEIDYVYPTDLAKGYTALGEKDKAFEWLEKAVEARVPDILIIKYAPAFDSLRDEARFQKILGQINFPQ